MKYLKKYDTIAGRDGALANTTIDLLAFTDEGGREAVSLKDAANPPQPFDEIWYTTTDGNVVGPNSEDYDGNPIDFGAQILSNTYTNGKGVIKFSDRVRTIPLFSFGEINRLETISLPYGVSRIKEEAFAGDINLKKVKLPGSLVYIEGYAFNGCESLASITIPGLVSEIGYDCFVNTGLKTVKIEDGATFSADGLFDGITSLQSAAIPGSVKHIPESSFSQCTGLTSVTIGDGVTSIEYYAFSYCRNLTSINIPNSVTTIKRDAFNDCTGLTSLNIPNGVTSIGENAFSQVLNVNYTGTATGSPWGARCVNGYMEGGLWYTDSTKTTLAGAPSAITGSVTIPNGVTTIGGNAFYYCRGLTSVTIPNGVTTIGIGAFSNCTGLTSVTMPDSVTSIGMMAFYFSSGLTSITCEATTPPTLGDGWAFDTMNNCPIYVPAASVDAYKAASVWSKYASRIQAIP